MAADRMARRVSHLACGVEVRCLDLREKKGFAVGDILVQPATSVVKFLADAAKPVFGVKSEKHRGTRLLLGFLQVDFCPPMLSGNCYRFVWDINRTCTTPHPRAPGFRKGQWLHSEQFPKLPRTTERKRTELFLLPTISQNDSVCVPRLPYILILSTLFFRWKRIVPSRSTKSAKLMAKIFFSQR